MERAICELGIVPFFTSAIPDYSIKELTQPGFWFDGEEDSLGPWDWKIDCLQNGGIAYGKFPGRGLHGSLAGTAFQRNSNGIGSVR